MCESRKRREKSENATEKNSTLRNDEVEATGSSEQNNVDGSKRPHVAVIVPSAEKSKCRGAKELDGSQKNSSQTLGSASDYLSNKWPLSVYLLLFSIPRICACKWPSADVLFILDSTFNVNQLDHQKQIEFVDKVLQSIDISSEDSHVSLAQFTPEARYEFGLADTANRPEAEMRLQSASYAPCDASTSRTGCQTTSVNTLAKYSLDRGNRKYIPDVIVVISSSKYTLPELLDKETLMFPVSPIHFFHISIAGPTITHFEPSARTIPFGANDFTLLNELSDPLCKSVNLFLTGEINSAQFGTVCWTVIGILIAVFLVSTALLVYALYSYREEALKLRQVQTQMEKNLRTQNEYFTAKLHSQMEEQIKTSQKHAEEIKMQQATMQAQHDELAKRLEETKAAASNQPAPSAHPQPIIIPFYPPNTRHDVSQQRNTGPRNENRVGNGTDEMIMTNPDGTTTRFVRDANGIMRAFKTEKTNPTANGTLPTAREKGDGHHISRLNLEESNASRLWRSEDPNSVSEGTESVISLHGGLLPHDHPARSLPPIDIMFLVDSSSSIGIANFEALKVNICNVLDDIDIAPGRSRVSLIQYAQEPSVVFGFDKYYSTQSVKKGVMRMSYTGGATMLAKALAFAAGILYKEQNLKDRKRRHKLLRTPRHDRLQILCLASDGYSEDKIENATNNLHDRLQIKIFAMVTRSFNKEKLIPVTRFEGSIFMMDQKESISIWLWRQQVG
ncbi:hypothetical protein WR25_12640 [Diploscapter pachys]|uniref:VWFA domain-containing protein n=1 Tax=Diploscapter pachys TaxID=2018661 RepID=A0A2A2L388_9BILA|nr:hypothetical protein WR25_12640 [Diploscapter pachys]